MQSDTKQGDTEESDRSDEDIIKRAVFDQILQHEQESCVKMGDIHFNEVLKLNLDDQHIVELKALKDFTSLTRLDLSNNLIERIRGLNYMTKLTWLNLSVNRIDKIEGLDNLKNLTWLNMSFNRIETIEGLESQQKLELLNLSNNRITVLENMDKLEKLTHFCVAKNLIGEFNAVAYLRKFTNLFSVTLYGNPISIEDDYPLYIIAILPNLTLLDNALLNEETIKEAYVKHHFQIETLRIIESQKQEEDGAQHIQESALQLHSEAFVEFLSGSHLFKSLFKDDPMTEALRSKNKVAHLHQIYEQQMGDLCSEIFEIGLAEQKRRKTEIDSFFSNQKKTVADYLQKAAVILAEFEQQHKDRVLECQQLTDRDTLKVKIRQCHDEINRFHYNYMSVEFELIKLLEGSIEEFETKISEMVENFILIVQNIFVKCQNLEKQFYEKVNEFASTAALPIDATKLLSEEQTITDALTSSHNNRVQMITDRETLLVTNVTAWKESLIRRTRENEVKMHRVRILDFIERTRDWMVADI